MEKLKKKLVLENGDVFYGEGFGANTTAIGEVVFNTSMAGYQEVVSDLGYTGQMIVMSYPIIGSYGITDEDYESKSLGLKAMIVREYNDNPSNFRYTKTLSELLEENNIPGIQGIDTRKLVTTLREKGNMLGAIVDGDFEDEKALQLIKDYIYPTDEVKQAGCKKRWYSRTPNHKYNVVAVDCGIKFQMIRALNAVGCNVIMVPYTITAEEIANLKPDGVFFSNGPGNPENAEKVVKLAKEIEGKFPIMGVGLGHQVLALALGATTYKMKNGHHGANHPVRNSANNQIEIVTQNHNYAVDKASLEKAGALITHLNLLDGSVEGFEVEKDGLFALQFYPDNIRYFEKFTDKIKEYNSLCQREQI